MKTYIWALVLTGAAFAAGVLVGPRLATVGRTHVVRRPSDYARGLGDLGGVRGGKPGAGASKVAVGSIHALGRIEPNGGLYAVGAPAGMRIDRLLVSEGDEVQEGQELAYVEGYAERKAQIGLIEAQLAEARDQSQAEHEYEATLDDEATVERRGADILETLDRQLQEKNIKVLEEKAKISSRDYEVLVELQRDKRSMISQQELERQFLVTRQDAATLESARAELNKMQKGRETRRAKLDVALLKAKVASRRTRLAIPKRSLEKQLDLAKQQLNQSVIRSPRSGRVLSILAKPGEAVGPRPVLQLGDTRRMYVVAEVDEEEIPLVSRGQKASITSHALDRPYTGVVESWALMVAKNDVLGLDPAAAAYARVVEIKIRLDDPCDDLRDRTHMQVTAVIAVDAQAPKASPDRSSTISAR